jgi:hypothetical protein
MFDPDYRPEDEPLSAKDAILAMVDGGETLYDKSGNEYYWDKGDKRFYHRYLDTASLNAVVRFNDVYYRPARRKRPMTRWEILAWATSEESRGWLVRSRFIGDVGFWRQWDLPQRFSYDTCEGMADDGLFEYQRARMLPDNSGIDESTIQGFEIEVEE